MCLPWVFTGALVWPVETDKTLALGFAHRLPFGELPSLFCWHSCWTGNRAWSLNSTACSLRWCCRSWRFSQAYRTRYFGSTSWSHLLPGFLSIGSWQRWHCGRSDKGQPACTGWQLRATHTSFWWRAWFSWNRKLYFWSFWLRRIIILTQERKIAIYSI